jgi:predicted permease
VLLILTVTIPIFTVMLAGYFSARRGLIGPAGIQAFTGFVFYFALPLMLFHNLANAPVAEQFNAAYVAAYALAGLILFGFGMAVARFGFGCNWPEQTVQGLGVSLGHTVFITIPIASALYGKASNLPVALLIAVEMGMTVPLAVLLLEIGQGEGAAWRKAAWAGIKSALASPIILSILLGAGFALMNIELPVVLDGVVGLVRGATVPCALYAIGASLAGLPLTERMRETSFIALAKLFVYPAAVFALMSLVPDLDPAWRNIAVIAAATPVGVSVYLVASTYNAYQARVSTATLASTVISVITLSALVAIFS